MVIVRHVEIRPHERGLLFRNKVFERLLAPGRHWILGASWKIRIERVSVRDAAFGHEDLEVIVRSGALAGEAEVLDLADHERALVWIDGRFDRICGPGQHVFWTAFHTVRTETLDARELRFEHPALATILGDPRSHAWLCTVPIEAGHTGVVFRDGRHEVSLEPGTHALWTKLARLRVVPVDLREQVLDIAGQEIMTADKVSLRLNALVAFFVVDALASLTRVDDAKQALYREAQLALRAVVGARELDALLADKDAVARELGEAVARRAREFGCEVAAVGIRDVILPGEMKTLMNRVTEARKAAEAQLIARREETAAMRSQANTARIFETSPVLMKLRELEVLEKISERAQLQVVLTESGLADRVTKLI